MQGGDAILVENCEKAENCNNAFLKFATINTSNVCYYVTVHICQHKSAEVPAEGL